jgi:dTDP-4-amino-4,6-dideoxygalactose transaminase
MLPYGRHSINKHDIAAVVGALKSKWLTTGPVVEKFEYELEQITGAPCISVSSGTAALHCAYAAIGLNAGDEIITPPITFIATQATAALFGAKVVFSDVQADTANIDPKAVEAAITSKTKAIVAVDFAGHPADLNELRAIANRHKLFLIEDAAHSVGSIYRGRRVGSIADLTTFSFFPTKNFTTGEGGAVASIHPDLLEKAKRFSRQGLVRNKNEFIIRSEGNWHQEVHEFGLNYRLPDILCALGISQLSRLAKFKARRREIFDHYSHLLENLDLIEAPLEREYVSSNWHLYPIKVQVKERERIFNELLKAGIGVQVNYIPAYWHPVFQKKGHKIGEFPISDNFYKREISLPMHFEVSNNDIRRIVELLASII